MSYEELTYYRVTCDHLECRSYINVAARNTIHLGEVLKSNKWVKPSNWSSAAFCPAHVQDVNPQCG